MRRKNITYADAQEIYNVRDDPYEIMKILTRDVITGDEIQKIFNIKDDDVDYRKIYDIKKIYNYIEDDEIKEIFINYFKEYFNVYNIEDDEIDNIEDDEIRGIFLIKYYNVYKLLKLYENLIYNIYKELIKKGIIVSNGKFYKLKSNKYGRFNKKSMVNANNYIIENYFGMYNGKDLSIYDDIINQVFHLEFTLEFRKYAYVVNKINFETIKEINRAREFLKRLIKKLIQNKNF